MAHLRTRTLDDIVILTPHGYLMGDHETDELAQAMRDHLERGNRKLIIDLIETVHLNSIALGVLDDARQRYQRQGGLIRLCRVSHRIQNALVITRLSMFFDVHGSEREAVEAFQAAETTN